MESIFYFVDYTSDQGPSLENINYPSLRTKIDVKSDTPESVTVI